jgi:hypothetical protein
MLVPFDELSIDEVQLVKCDTADIYIYIYGRMKSNLHGTLNVGGNTVTTIKFAAQDGGPLDEDGLANGEFVDPNGPAIAVATSPVAPIVNAVNNLLRIGGFAQKDNAMILAILAILTGITIGYGAVKRGKRNR